MGPIYAKIGLSQKPCYVRIFVTISMISSVMDRDRENGSEPLNHTSPARGRQNTSLPL